MRGVTKGAPAAGCAAFAGGLQAAAWPPCGRSRRSGGPLAGRFHPSRRPLQGVAGAWRGETDPPPELCLLQQLVASAWPAEQRCRLPSLRGGGFIVACHNPPCAPIPVHGVVVQGALGQARGTSLAAEAIWALWATGRWPSRIAELQGLPSGRWCSPHSGCGAGSWGRSPPEVPRRGAPPGSPAGGTSSTPKGPWGTWEGDAGRPAAASEALTGPRATPGTPALALVA